MTIIVKQDYWYISQISGEHLQDHWSSSFHISWFLENDAATQEVSIKWLLLCIRFLENKLIAVNVLLMYQF